MDNNGKPVREERIIRSVAQNESEESCPYQKLASSFANRRMPMELRETGPKKEFLDKLAQMDIHLRPSLKKLLDFCDLIFFYPPTTDAELRRFCSTMHCFTAKLVISYNNFHEVVKVFSRYSNKYYNTISAAYKDTIIKSSQNRSAREHDATIAVFNKIDPLMIPLNLSFQSASSDPVPPVEPRYIPIPSSIGGSAPSSSATASMMPNDEPIPKRTRRM